MTVARKATLLKRTPSSRSFQARTLIAEKKLRPHPDDFLKVSSDETDEPITLKMNRHGKGGVAQFNLLGVALHIPDHMVLYETFLFQLEHLPNLSSSLKSQ